MFESDGTINVSLGSVNVGDGGTLVYSLSRNVNNYDTISGTGNIVVYNSANYSITFANISGAIANNIQYE